MQDFARAIASCLEEDLPYQINPFITNDMEISDARIMSMKNSFFKKFLDDSDPKRDELCLSLFKSSNAGCKGFTFKPQRLFDDVLINLVKQEFDNLFFRGPDHRISLSDLEEGLLPGPGASLEATSYNFYSKLFDSPLSYTDNRLLHMYRSAASRDPKWLHAETLRELRFGTIAVRGNRLSYVPKTSKISRAICTEPSLNMLYQKGLGSCLERLLRTDFSISLSTQPDLNKKLARLGSSDGSFGTIDLKSASDSISLELLEQILPRYVLTWMKMFRSPRVIFPDDSEDELYMVSSMGNGFNFPLQTLLFSVLVKASYSLLGIPLQRDHNGPLNFGVFGDDIIVRKDAYDYVVGTLELFGFTVNKEKSFNSGFFRESCGGDYFHGHDIRGVYVKSLKQESDVFSIINRVIRWCIHSGVPLPRTYRLLRGRCRFLPVPLHANDTEGVKIPLRSLESVRRDRNGSVIYRALTPVPRTIRVPRNDGESLKATMRSMLQDNPSGILISLIGGYIRNGRITLRSEGVVRYKVRKRKTPSWDYTTTAVSRRQVHDWEVMYELLTTSS